MDTRPRQNIAAIPSLFYFSPLQLSIELALLNLKTLRPQLARCVKSMTFVAKFMQKVRDYERVSLSSLPQLGDDLGPTNS